MPKRSGLGQRGLDLLIPVTSQKAGSGSGTKAESEEKVKSAGKKKAKDGTSNRTSKNKGKPTESRKASEAKSDAKGKAGSTIGEKSSTEKPKEPVQKTEDKSKIGSKIGEKKTTVSKKASASKTTGKNSASTGSKETGKSTAKTTAAVKKGGSKKNSANVSKEEKRTTDQNAIEPSALENKTKDTYASEAFREANESGKPVMVPTSLVEPNRQQPRKSFDEDALQELAESIKQFGIIQPLIVQKKEGYYEIIAGERRWRAARIASLKEVPVIIREYTPREVMEISLIENIQREDLNPIEEAGAYVRLMEEFSLKQDEVAQRVSKSRAAIANSVRLLNLDQRVQDMIIEQMLTTGHARALLAITDPEQQYQTAQKVFDEKLTVRDVERLVRKMNQPPVSVVSRKINESLEAIYLDMAEKMKSALGTKVSIAAKSPQKGKIEIEYYSMDELDRLCTLLNNAGSQEEV